MASSTPISSARQANAASQAAWWSLRVLSLALLLAATAVPAAFAQVRISLAWDANTDELTAGYRLLVRNSAGVSLGTIDVGAATSAVLPLAPGH